MAISIVAGLAWAPGATRSASAADENPNGVLEWNQIFIDTLIATNTANSSSQRLGAIVHTAIFDAFNGVERRYTPVFVHESAPPGASRRAAVIAAAYTALVALFPSRQQALADSYAASLAALSDDGGDGGESRERGIAWGTEVAQAVLAWRATDGFNPSTPYPAFRGGEAIGQWRPTPPAFGAMSAQGLAFTSMFVLVNNTQFEPGTTARPRQHHLHRRFQCREGTRSRDRFDAHGGSDRAGAVLGGERQRPLESGSQSDRARQPPLLVRQQPAPRRVEHRDGRHGVHDLERKRYYGGVATEVTWRPVTAIPLAGTDGNPDTTPDPDWLPLVTTPSHPEYLAGHPSHNGAAATVLLSHFDDNQTFTLTTTGLPSRTYTSIAQARSDGNNARVWGGMHYPSTVAISDGVGEAIANYVNLNAMQRLRGRP